MKKIYLQPCTDSVLLTLSAAILGVSNINPDYADPDSQL